MNDVMVFIKEAEMYNFADDATKHSYSLDYEEAHRKLSNDTHIVLN